MVVANDTGGFKILFSSTRQSENGASAHHGGFVVLFKIGKHLFIHRTQFTVVVNDVLDLVWSQKASWEEEDGEPSRFKTDSTI